MYWGHMSVLDADLICLRELRARNKHWQHAATLAGTGEKKNIFFFSFSRGGTLISLPQMMKQCKLLKPPRKLQDYFN